MLVSRADEGQFMRKVVPRDNFLYGYLIPILSRYCRSGQRVLDIGCGVGPLSLYAASLGCDVVGLDISGPAIEACRRSADFLGLSDRVSFETADFVTAPITGPFDLIVCFEVLEHIPDDRGALLKMAQLLAPEGRLLLSTPSANSPLHRLRVRRLGRDPFDVEAGHLRRYTTEQLCEMLERTGFDVEHMELAEGLFRSSLPLTPLGRLVLRAVRSWLTPVLIAIDRMTVWPLGEGQVIVVARHRPST